MKEVEALKFVSFNQMRCQKALTMTFIFFGKQNLMHQLEQRKLELNKKNIVLFINITNEMNL